MDYPENLSPQEIIWRAAFIEGQARVFQKAGELGCPHERQHRDGLLPQEACCLSFVEFLTDLRIRVSGEHAEVFAQIEQVLGKITTTRRNHTDEN